MGECKINKNKYVLLLIFSLLTFSFITIVSADSGSVIDDQTLVVGFNPEFPPFGYRDEHGQFTGFDVDLAKEVCKRNNWTLKLQPITNWDTKDTELNAGMMDCIWSELTITGRENEYTWTKPYFNNTQVVVVKSNSNISTLNDLKGKHVEVQEGSSVLKVLEGNNKSFTDNFAELTKIKDYNTGFMNLEIGTCDALIVDVSLADYHIKDKSGKFKILDEPVSFEQYAVGFKSGNEDLKNQVQQTLNEMFEDGTVNEIAHKYKDYNIESRLISP